jgi:hypothetical protein
VPAATYGSLLQLAEHVTRTVHGEPPPEPDIDREQQRVDQADLTRALNRPPTMSDA